MIFLSFAFNIKNSFSVDISISRQNENVKNVEPF